MLCAASQGISREQFEGIKPDYARMHAASTDDAIFAVALTVPADEDGVIHSRTAVLLPLHISIKHDFPGSRC